MLFFFELFLFVLVMLTLALGEFVSRGLALGLWLVVTAFAVGGYFLAAGALRPFLVDQDEQAARHRPDLPGDRPGVLADIEPATADPTTVGQALLDQKWARTLLYNWRRANVLLVLGALAVGGWYWLGA